MKRQPNGQRGMVLVVALILLVVATLLGVNLASTGSLELKMARNMQETARSFEFAQGGVAAVWGLIADRGTVGSQNGDILRYNELFDGGVRPAWLLNNDIRPDLFVLERELTCPRLEEGSSADKIACDYYRIEATHDGGEDDVDDDGFARVRVAQGAFIRIFK
ncbi:conserved protein of unknown function [Thauera humireducens]|uniref:PilX N-terminal domain-containing pilus assembly protein n=1 Tax=Thauera humireducens TaxID=1134435 RepID=UPI002467A5C7|nr:PilX N-terminal domain-containing pilus assembly protein [Thauera humireducens]CAH1748585.1 conserved protein of unknown function [Thauera humireducens]